MTGNEMKTILWIVDGVGWGYDNLSKAVSKELPHYKHVMLSKKMNMFKVDGEIGYVSENDESFKNRIDAVGADLIMSMNPLNQRFFNDKTKGVLRLSGIRCLHGWKR